MVNFIMSDPQLLKCVGIRKSNAPRGDRNERPVQQRKFAYVVSCLAEALADEMSFFAQNL